MVRVRLQLDLDYDSDTQEYGFHISRLGHPGDGGSDKSRAAVCCWLYEAAEKMLQEARNRAEAGVKGQ
jgi:hypothetical protein